MLPIFVLFFPVFIFLCCILREIFFLHIKNHVALTQMIIIFTQTHSKKRIFLSGFFFPQQKKKTFFYFIFGSTGWKANWNELKIIPRARTDWSMRSSINRHVSNEDFFLLSTKIEIFFSFSCLAINFFILSSASSNFLLLLLLLLCHGKMENFSCC